MMNVECLERNFQWGESDVRMKIKQSYIEDEKKHNGAMQCNWVERTELGIPDKQKSELPVGVTPSHSARSAAFASVIDKPIIRIGCSNCAEM